MRAPRVKTRVTKKHAKKRTTYSLDLPNEEELDNLDLEVDLDSLGSFFIHLMTMTIIRTTLKAVKLMM